MESTATNKVDFESKKRGKGRKQSKNVSHSVEKLLKAYPEHGTRNIEVETVLEARRRGSRNDSSTQFVKALNYVNQDPDLSLSVKLGETHAELSNFKFRNTVY